jgi:hypothetical protein
MAENEKLMATPNFILSALESAPVLSWLHPSRQFVYPAETSTAFYLRGELV